MPRKSVKAYSALTNSMRVSKDEPPGRLPSVLRAELARTSSNRKRPGRQAPSMPKLSCLEDEDKP